MLVPDGGPAGCAASSDDSEGADDEQRQRPEIREKALHHRRNVFHVVCVAGWGGGSFYRGSCVASVIWRQYSSDSLTDIRAGVTVDCCPGKDRETGE
ncbi:hypothetical protein EL75_4888 [Escherichia coli]|nr:hypothetical protein EL75_4888 [Escherichia coli]